MGDNKILITHVLDDTDRVIEWIAEIGLAKYIICVSREGLFQVYTGKPGAIVGVSDTLFQAKDLILRHQQSVVSKWKAKHLYNIVSRFPQKPNVTAEEALDLAIQYFYEELTT